MPETSAQQSRKVCGQLGKPLSPGSVLCASTRWGHLLGHQGQTGGAGRPRIHAAADAAGQTQNGPEEGCHLFETVRGPKNEGRPRGQEA